MSKRKVINLIHSPCKSKYIYMFNIIPVTLQRDVIDRERTTGIYRLSAFYCSVMASEILFVCIVQPLLFYPLVYWISGMAVHPIAFFTSVAIFLLFITVAQVYFNCMLWNNLLCGLRQQSSNPGVGVNKIGIWVLFPKSYLWEFTTTHWPHSSFLDLSRNTVKQG